jgi:hypothetical protein
MARHAVLSEIKWGKPVEDSKLPPLFSRILCPVILGACPHIDGTTPKSSLTQAQPFQRGKRLDVP